MAAAPAAPATAPAPATPALPPPAIAAQPSAAPIAPSGLDTLTEAQNLPEDTGTDATEAEDTGPEAMGTEAIALPDPTTPQTQHAIPSVAAQVAQPTSKPDTGDKPDLTKDPEASKVPSLAAPTLPMAAPLVPAPPTAPVPTGDSAPTSPALSAEAAPLAPAETAPPPTLATTEGSVLAAPQPALPGSAPAPLATAPLPQTLDLAAPQWPEQMVQDIRQSASAALDNLTLTLTPERLGPLQIRLETQDGVTHVHIVTETPEAARAMAEAQPRLAEAMARAGLEMGSQSTTTTGGSGGAAGFGTTGGDANPRGNGHPGTEPGPQGNATAFDDTASQPLSPRAPARSSIDLIA